MFENLKKSLAILYLASVTVLGAWTLAVALRVLTVVYHCYVMFHWTSTQNARIFVGQIFAKRFNVSLKTAKLNFFWK